MLGLRKVAEDPNELIFIAKVISSGEIEEDQEVKDDMEELKDDLVEVKETLQALAAAKKH